MTPSGTVCKRCGEPHESRNGGPPCKGHVMRDGGRGCRKNAVIGLDVCASHGVTKAAKAAGRRRVAEEKAAQAMRRFGGPIETTATEALIETVKWTAGYVAWLRDKVANTRTDKDLIWGMTRTKTGGDDRGTTYQSGANAWLVLLGEWQDRLVKVCAAAISAGIEERRVRLAEQQGALVADVIKRILGDLELSEAQQAKSSEVVVRHLRLLTA